MAIDLDIKPTAKFEATERNGLTLLVHYSLPFDTWEKSGWLKRGFGGRNGSFTTEQHDYTAAFCIFNGSFQLGQMRHGFMNLAPFEIANEHEWRGAQPIEIKTNYAEGEKVVDRERSVFSIASFDQASGERVTLGATHAPRDQLFTVQTRLGMVMDQAKRLAAPYEAEIRANYKGKRVSPDTEEDKAMVEELRRDWEENNPDWEW